MLRIAYTHVCGISGGFFLVFAYIVQNKQYNRHSLYSRRRWLCYLHIHLCDAINKMLDKISFYKHFKSLEKMCKIGQVFGYNKSILKIKYSELIPFQRFSFSKFSGNCPLHSLMPSISPLQTFSSFLRPRSKL